jgi:hypothetical protein
MRHDFYKFCQSNMFFLPREGHIWDMVSYAYTDWQVVINTGQKLRIGCNFHSSCIANNWDGYMDLI